MKLTVFTVEEANALMPELAPRLERLMASKREFDRLQGRIEVLKLATAFATAENPDRRELRRLVEQQRIQAETISQGIGSIHRRGVLVKDLDRGLLDFYALAGDRLVFLCWQMGEPEVAHWHSLEGGFTSRQPLHHTEQE